MPVRCNHCNRVALPVVPGTVGGNGSLARPVAHVRSTYDVASPVGPCFEGIGRPELEKHSTDSVTLMIKERIWNDDSLWDLDGD